MVKFLFRRSIFPILVETDKRMYGIPTASHFDKFKKEKLFQTKIYYKVINGRGEGWSYVPEYDVISPLATEKVWTKKQIINFFNSSLKNQNIEDQFVLKSLSNTRLDEIIFSLVEFSIDIENKNIKENKKKI